MVVPVLAPLVFSKLNYDPKPELAARLLGMGLEVAGGSAADLQKALDDDTARWAPVVKASGFKAD